MPSPLSSFHQGWGDSIPRHVNSMKLYDIIVLSLYLTCDNIILAELKTRSVPFCDIFVCQRATMASMCFVVCVAAFPELYSRLLDENIILGGRFLSDTGV